MDTRMDTDAHWSTVMELIVSNGKHINHNITTRLGEHFLVSSRSICQRGWTIVDLQLSKARLLTRILLLFISTASAL